MVNVRNHIAYVLLAAIVGGLYVILYYVPIELAIVILNGLFSGSIVAVMYAFSRLFWYAIKLGQPFNRVRQMTLGFFALWIAYCCSVGISIYLRTAGIEVHPTAFTVASRYFAIIAAWLQVTAPDFGLGVFYGHDRKILWTFAIGGLFVSLFLIYAQNNELLAVN